MPVTNDTTQLTGLLKNVYAKGIVDAYSFAAPLASRLIKISPISPTKPRREQYLDAARQLARDKQ